MKWIIIVGGGCLVLWLMSKLIHPYYVRDLLKLKRLRKMSRWVYSARYRQRNKTIKLLTARREFLLKEMNKVSDEIRGLK